MAKKNNLKSVRLSDLMDKLLEDKDADPELPFS